MTTTVTELLERWDSGDGKPYKGSLIDWRSYEADPTNMGCMCAQGQALHLIGGMTPEEIDHLEQQEADTRVMEIFGISRAHSILLRSVNDKVDGAPSIVITNPEKVLGDQAHIILAFWKYLDSLDYEGWQKVVAAGGAAWAAARVAAGDAAWASNEIQGASILKEKGKPLFFLGLFGFKTVEAILDWVQS